jgi:hypothetical protein
VLLIYAAAFLIAMVALVRWYEEPTLARRFGAQDGALPQAGARAGRAGHAARPDSRRTGE